MKTTEQTQQTAGKVIMANLNRVVILCLSLFIQINSVKADPVTLTEVTGQAGDIVTLKLVIAENSTLPNAILSIESQINYEADTNVLSFVQARVGKAFPVVTIAPIFLASERTTGVINIVLGAAIAAETVVNAELIELDFQIKPQSQTGDSIIKLIKLDFDEGVYQYQRSQDPATADGKISINANTSQQIHNLQAGFNLFNYPAEVAQEHSSCLNLLSSLNNIDPVQERVNSITSYNPLNQSFTRCMSGSAEDYNIQSNHSYLIDMKTAVEITINSPANCMPLTLKAGLNLQGHPAASEIESCYSLLTEINTTGTSIQSFDTTTGRFKSCNTQSTTPAPIQNQGEDFDINTGQGLLIHMPVEKTVNLTACGAGQG